MNDPIEALGFRLSLGAQEVDRILTPEEIAIIRLIAIAYVQRKEKLDNTEKMGE